MKIRRERHRVWSLSYHAVFVVKYRKPCITDEIADFLLDEMRHLLEGWGGELIEGKADRDHLEKHNRKTGKSSTKDKGHIAKYLAELSTHYRGRKEAVGQKREAEDYGWQMA